MMKARYLPSKQCWRVYYGKALTEVRGSRRWSRREWLEADLRRAGLRMDPETGCITILDIPTVH